MSTLSTKSTARRRLLGGASVIAIAGLLAACGQAPEEDPDAGNGGDGGDNGASDVVPCMVSDAGGFDDQSFNELSHNGLEAGSEAHGLTPIAVESENDTVYESNIESLVNQGCNLIFSVGFLLQPATETMAANYTDVSFAIIDDDQIDAPNVKPLIYNTAEAAFLAGYAAADYTESGIVATWGGINIPTVTIFMDGFALGVEYYNEQNGTDVEVRGWDVEAQDGSFTGGFEANPEARSMAEQFISQGADVLLPVGGPIFQPAAEAVLDAQGDNPHIAMVGVDTDLTESAPNYADIFLTSILKGLAVSVEDTIGEAVNGEFTNEPFVGTLDNDGVGIAPFYDFADDLSDTIEDDIEQLRQAIIDGEIVVESPSSPSV